jgi:prepilin-type N-terminal cleavage/methylation domain-containing protein
MRRRFLRTRLAAPDPERGITLFELMIVIVMIGILSGIAASRLDWTRYRADSVARGLAAEMGGAQRLAVSLQENVRVTVLDSSRVQIHEDADDDGAVGSGERVRMIQLADGFSIGQGSAADIPAPSDPTVLAAILFRRDGTADRSGTFYVQGPGDDPACRHCRAIAVTRATGRLVTFSYATGTWVRGN